LREKTQKRLDFLSKETHRPVAYYVEKAIEDFLEDREDYLLAVAELERVEKEGEETVSFAEILQKYGMDDARH
jgi:RHH-type rel operon transcriptional repressor/antitoxin RelB